MQRIIIYELVMQTPLWLTWEYDLRMVHGFGNEIEFIRIVILFYFKIIIDTT